MSLSKVLGGLSNETLRRWERLWFVEEDGVLPTVCLHPGTARMVGMSLMSFMCPTHLLHKSHMLST